MPKHLLLSDLQVALAEAVCCGADKPSSGMARGELRSTLSRAGSCRCRHAKYSRKN